MKRVLVTGAPERADALRKVFEKAGVDTVTLAELGHGSPAIDYYVQLGVMVPVRGDTVVRRAHMFLNDGLLERFALAERISPLLADDAVVLLVSGNLPTEISAPDDQGARLSLLRVLAHAMRADLAPRHVRIRVITSGQSDEQIAEYALSGAKDPKARPRWESADTTNDRTYEDWRVQVLGTVQVEV